MPVAEGGQNAHRVVTDAGQDDPVVGDAQPGQVLVEVPVILQGFVPVSNARRRREPRARVAAFCSAYRRGLTDRKRSWPPP